MKLAFTSLGSPAWNIDQVAQNAKAMGFDGVELRGIAGEHLGPQETPEERRRIRKLFADNGVEIAAIMGYSKFTFDDPKARQESVDIALQFIETARDIGCPVLRVFGGMVPPDKSREIAAARIIEGLKAIAPQAEKAGIDIAMETHDDWCRGADIMAVINAVGSPRIGICWDCCNSYFIEPLETTYKAICGCIKHVHFKDAARVPGETRKVTSVLPGQGEADLRQALSLLHRGGYRRYLSFEWEKKWQPDLADPEIAFPHFVKFTAGLMAELGVPRG